MSSESEKDDILGDVDEMTGVDVGGEDSDLDGSEGAAGSGEEEQGGDDGQGISDDEGEGGGDIRRHTRSQVSKDSEQRDQSGGEEEEGDVGNVLSLSLKSANEDVEKGKAAILQICKLGFGIWCVHILFPSLALGAVAFIMFHLLCVHKLSLISHVCC